MGNEGSKLKGLSIDKTAVEANDFFVLYNASKEPINNKSSCTTTNTNEEGRLEKLSIFQAERGTFTHTLWGKQGPVKHAIRNYMIYRHPYILKFIATWEQSGETYLATERVRPLTNVLGTLSDIQICLGLRTILCGLIFLTEKALARHLNICPASIYITENGSWRLAGFEYVWKSNELKNELIELLNEHRYKAGVDPEETIIENRNTIEQYAFATLCEEILGRKAKSKNSNKVSDCETPHKGEFREYCITVLQHKKPEMRPKLAAILLHPYFNHEFILIHSFLFELPLKSLPEKQAFFTSLVDRLRYFNENVVASQLAADLLSRMVLLDPTAQLCVTPYVLKNKNVENTSALFGREAYQRHVMPHIRRMFRLRDAQIRLILLEYFMEYVRLLTEEELKEFILPHLLIGINDTNDVLVAKTLRCLADLIPILGAAVVCQFSGERIRLFSDGRPHANISADSVNATHWVEPRSITPVLTSGQENRIGGAISISDGEEVGYMVSASPIPGNIELGCSFNSLTQTELPNEDQVEMPPRLSPDGGEDDKNTIIMDGLITGVQEIESNACSYNTKLHISSENEEIKNKSQSNYLTDVEEDTWSDWETDQVVSTEVSEKFENSVTPNSVTKYSNPKQIIDDLSSFDIQIQKILKLPTEKRDEYDFFKDMEPVIKSVEKIINHADTQLKLPDEIEHNFEEDHVLIDTSRFAAISHVDGLLNNDNLGSGSDHGWDVEDDEADAAYLQNKT